MSNTSTNPQEKTTSPAIRAYLGGSFDPVHKGHLEVALHVYQSLLPIAMQQQCALHVSLLPNARSPFKTQSTHPAHRLAMLKLAVQDTPIQISELELWQTPPVYTIDSVRALRQQYPNDHLIFIMGMDSARSLDRWKNGLDLTRYVNLWVFNRTDSSETSHDETEVDMTDTTTDTAADSVAVSQKRLALQAQLPMILQPQTVHAPIALLAPHNPLAATSKDADSTALKNAKQGRIYIDPRPITAVSSTQIRKQLALLGQQMDKMHSAPIMPINDIMGHTPPNSLLKWLNPAVYHYIIAHQLYSAAQFR